MCVCVSSLLDVLDLHAGRAAAARAHEMLRPQLRDLCTPRLKQDEIDYLNSRQKDSMRSKYSSCTAVSIVYLYL